MWDDVREAESCRRLRVRVCLWSKTGKRSNLISIVSLEKTQSPCRKSAVLTFLSVLSLLSLTWKAGTKQHDIRSQHAVVSW